ncbi:MAG: CpaF family protein, partial [Acetobacteraceae bacterium]
MSAVVPVARFGRRQELLDPRPPAAAAPPPEPAPLAPAATGAPPPDAIAELRTLCLARLDPTVVSNMPAEQLRTDIERLISELASLNRFQINAREQRGLATELVHDILGLGPLETLLADDAVTDIMVNGPQRTFIERAGKAMLSDVKFRDASHLIGICQRIAAGVGRRIDESSPMVDARLKDGSRVNIVFPPLALDGPYVSIRKFSRRAIDLNRLVEFGALTAPMARALQVAGRARLNIIISGGTGSGKTTLLNALSRFIDVSER